MFLSGVQDTRISWRLQRAFPNGHQAIPDVPILERVKYLWGELSQVEIEATHAPAKWQEIDKFENPSNPVERGSHWSIINSPSGAYEDHNGTRYQKVRLGSSGFGE